MSTLSYTNGSSSDGAINNVRLGTFCQPVVRVEDGGGRPVAETKSAKRKTKDKSAKDKVKRGRKAARA